MTGRAESLLRGFEARSLDTAAFRHREHVAVAYEMLRRHDFIEAAARYGEGIRALAAKAGEPRKFNTTVTLAFMSLIAERMATTAHADVEAFIAANPDLLSKALLERWYPPERLGSDLAREVFLMPEAARAS